MNDEPQKPDESYEDTVVPQEEEEEAVEEGQSRHRIRHYKAEEVMQQECNDYVMAGKRLPKLHSRWIYNRFINAGYSLYASSQAQKYLNEELDQAKITIRQLRERIAALEGES